MMCTDDQVYINALESKINDLEKELAEANNQCEETEKFCKSSAQKVIEQRKRIQELESALKAKSIPESNYQRCFYEGKCTFDDGNCEEVIEGHRCKYVNVNAKSQAALSGEKKITPERFAESIGAKPIENPIKISRAKPCNTCKNKLDDCYPNDNGTCEFKKEE
jgi:hypothetical protein